MFDKTNTLDLENLKAALTVVVGNDIIIPELNTTLTMLNNAPKINGYKWRYKGSVVFVDLSMIVDSETLINRRLGNNVNAIKGYVVRKLRN